MSKQKETESTNFESRLNKQEKAESINSTLGQSKQNESDSTNLTSSMSERKETEQRQKLNNDSMRVRIFLPEIHLNQLSTNGIGVSSSNNDPALEIFLKEEKIAVKDRINLLKQIDYCLMRLHTEKFLCNELLHSQIFIVKNIFENSTSVKSSDNEKQLNIHFLANLYCLILTNGKVAKYSEELTEKDLDCSYPYEALNIMKDMESGTITSIEEVMQHPFHWSDQIKVLFLFRAFDYIDAKHKNLHTETIQREKEILNQYKMGEEKEVIYENGWIEMLHLNKQELNKIQHRVSAEQSDVEVKKKLIYNFAVLKQSKKGTEMLIFELVRFFRNQYAHKYKDLDTFKFCFGDYPTGYLNFFSSRFPKLFMHVYKNMKTYICIDNDVGEFANVEFHQSLLNVVMRVDPANSSS